MSAEPRGQERPQPRTPTFRMSPFLKLSSVSLVPVKSYFPRASIRTALHRPRCDLSADKDSKGQHRLTQLEFASVVTDRQEIASRPKEKKDDVQRRKAGGASSSLAC